MSEELKDQRVTIMLTPSEFKAVEDWSFENRIRSRGEAIRRLINRGQQFDELSHMVQVIAHNYRLLSDESQRDEALKAIEIALFRQITAIINVHMDENSSQELQREFFQDFLTNQPKSK